jgi:four helix bundle protein
MVEVSFHYLLKQKIHKFIMLVYDITENFPKSELYGSTSQLRRASVSIMLNYVEGFSRRRPKVKLNFYEISYGSAQETKYILYLAKERGWMENSDYTDSFKLIDEIGKMLWSIIIPIEKDK